MEQDKLKKIIAEKNEERERRALRSAENLIEGIAQHQKQIECLQESIANLRKELHDLTVEQLDPEKLLG